MLTIWGRTNSINVQKPLMALEELGLAYKRIDAGLQFGVNTTPEFLAMNPNAVVPLIDDEGFILWESNAITRYLARKYGAGKLYPDDVYAQANQDRWMDWQHTSLVNPINGCFAPLIRKVGDQRPESIDAARAKAEEKLAMLDAWLDGKTWIGGDFFGCAECVLGPSVHRWYHLPVERQSHAHVERWLAALMARPSARKIIIEPIT